MNFRKHIHNLFVESYNDSVASNKELRDRVIKDFCSFAKQQLNIKTKCTIRIVPKRTDEMSTAVFFPDTNEMKILGGKRATIDILRSIAHELVHLQQQESGKEEVFNTFADKEKEKIYRDVGSPNEDEANARAGSLIKEFSRIYDGDLEDGQLYEI